MFNFLFQGKVGEIMAPITSPEAQLLIAIHNKQQDKIRELLEVQGVSANNANDKGVRPMHMACRSGDMALVQRLLALGADTITADKAGNTPLHYAAKYGHMELVKMFVGQGAAVEKRNGSRLTAYDLATDHVVRQYLLPLQLKAEAGNPEYAVDTMGITTDTPRDCEDFGAPVMGGMGGTNNPAQGHIYGHHNNTSRTGMGPPGSDAMNAALGALMQPAPNMTPPRPALSSVPPTGMVGPSTRTVSSFRPPGNSFAMQSAGSVLPVPASTSMTLPPGGQSALPRSLPTPGATVSSAPPLPSTSTAGPSSAPAIPTVPLTLPDGSKPSGTASVASAPDRTTSESFPSAGVPVRVQQQVPARDEPSAATGGGHASEHKDTGLMGTKSGEGIPGMVEKETSTVDMVVAKEVVGQSSSSPEAVRHGLKDGMGSGVDVGVGARFGTGAGAAPANLSSMFEAQAILSGPPTSFAPIALPSATLADQAPRPQPPPPRQSPPPAGEQAGKMKLIKPDGFHSSASDKALQLRYGHTKIVRDLGAPPTAAQLGAGVPIGPPPIYGASSYGQVHPPPIGSPVPPTRPPTGYLPQPNPYGQPFSSGQPFGQPFGHAQPPTHQPASPLPPAASQSMHTSAQHQYPFFAERQVSSLPQTHAPPGGGPLSISVLPYSPVDQSGATMGRGGLNGSPSVASYSVFNPTTDRVVAADSTSSSVL